MAKLRTEETANIEPQSMTGVYLQLIRSLQPTQSKVKNHWTQHPTKAIAAKRPQKCLLPPLQQNIPARSRKDSQRCSPVKILRPANADQAIRIGQLREHPNLVVPLELRSDSHRSTRTKFSSKIRTGEEQAFVHGRKKREKSSRHFETPERPHERDESQTPTIFVRKQRTRTRAAQKPAACHSKGTHKTAT